MVENSPILLVLFSLKERNSSNVLLSRLRIDWNNSCQVHQLQHHTKSGQSDEKFLLEDLIPTLELGIRRRISYFKNLTISNSLTTLNPGIKFIQKVLNFNFLI